MLLDCVHRGNDEQVAHSTGLTGTRTRLIIITDVDTRYRLDQRYWAGPDLDLDLNT